MHQDRSSAALVIRGSAAQEYYANTGALKNAAETAQGGKRVGCSIVETFTKSTKPRELEEVLRLEYRSKLLNPKWAQVGCVAQTLNPRLATHASKRQAFSRRRMQRGP